MRPLTERDIEKYLVARVKKIGGLIRKVKWIGRSNAPDRLLLLPLMGKRSVWVEVKAPGKKATPAQAREHERMRHHGQAVVVIDSLAGVDRLLA